MQAQKNQRYFIDTIWLSKELRQGVSVDELKTRVDIARQRGCNAMSICVSWDTEREDGSYDFSAYEAIMRHIVDSGMFLQLRMNTSLLWGTKLPWLQDEHLMCTEDGTVFTREEDGGQIPAISHPDVLKKKEQFYAACAAWTQKEKIPVICYSATWNLFMESEYYFVGLDYSEASCDAFVEWFAAYETEKTIQELNTLWRTDFADRNAVMLKNAPYPLRQMYFAQTLDDVFRRLSRALKDVHPEAQFGMQFGCFWDNPKRHNMLVDMRSPAIDWVFVADAPAFNFGFSNDALRACWRGRTLSNELDGPSRFIDAAGEQGANERAKEQGTVTFAHGVDAVYTCNWSAELYADDKRWNFQEPIAAMLNDPVADIQAKRAIYMSTWDLIHGSDAYEVYEAAWRQMKKISDAPIDILNDQALLADAAVLKQYEQIVLPHNEALTEPVRILLNTLPADLLRIDKPNVVGTKDPFANACQAFTLGE